jgi:hypothetical protein
MMLQIIISCFCFSSDISFKESMFGYSFHLFRFGREFAEAKSQKFDFVLLECCDNKKDVE